MARLLAIDYGAKRTGIAVSDSLQIIATALETVPTHTLENFLKTYFLNEDVERVIIGLPKNTNGEDTNATPLVQAFVNRFTKVFPNKELVLHDERFTSKMALDAMISGGMKKKERQKKENVDKVSATIILQSYMETIK